MRPEVARDGARPPRRSPRRTCGSRPPGPRRPGSTSSRSTLEPGRRLAEVGEDREPAGSRGSPRWPPPARGPRAARSPAHPCPMIRLNASSTLLANPAAISARAIVGRPSASSAPTCERRDLRIDRQADLAQQRRPSGRTGPRRRPAAPPAPPRTPRPRDPSRTRGCAAPPPTDPRSRVTERVDLDPGDQRHPVRHCPGRQTRDTRPACRDPSARRPGPRRAATATTSAAGADDPIRPGRWACRSTVDGPGGTTAQPCAPGRAARERADRAAGVIIAPSLAGAAAAVAAAAPAGAARHRIRGRRATAVSWRSRRWPRGSRYAGRHPMFSPWIVASSPIGAADPPWLPTCEAARSPGDVGHAVAAAVVVSTDAEPSRRLPSPTAGRDLVRCRDADAAASPRRHTS